MAELTQNLNGFQKQNNTLIRDVQPDVLDRLEVEIGDIKQPDFKPQFKLKRWQNEVNFSVRAEEHSSATATVEEGKVKYKTKDSEVHMYELNNGFDFEWVLPKKPKSNILTATLETKGLNFFYQPELSQEEIDQGAHRPENVIGSYAVYHATKGGAQRVDGQQYKTGKVAHIYRPHLIDAGGNESWADLFIDKDLGIYRITIPQDFLDNAVYPVMVGTPGTDIGYFNSYDAGEAWVTNPTNMDDGDTGTYASTNNNGEVQALTSHTTPPKTNISKVEIRAYGYGDGTDGIYLRPVFSGGDGDNHSFTPPNGSGSAGWSQWFDITSDTNAPADWDSSFKDLDVDVEYWKSGGPGDVFISKVEVRETYDNETFGYDTIGGTSVSIADADTGSQFSLSENGDITSITYRIETENTASDDRGVAIYNSSRSLLETSNTETADPSSGTWEELSLKSTVSANAGDYILIVNAQSVIFDTAYDSAPSVSRWSRSNTFNTVSDFDSTIPTASQTGKVSIYATYTATGGTTRRIFNIS